MSKLDGHGICHFKVSYDFKDFEKSIKFALQNVGIPKVTINQYNDGSAIIVHEWAETDEDLRFSHMISKKVVESFGGSYTIGGYH